MHECTNVACMHAGRGPRGALPAALAGRATRRPRSLGALAVRNPSMRLLSLYCRCMELYRYAQAFQPGHPHYSLRLQLARGVCPCCARICVR